ncbi:hypothetical protein O0I10_012886 [Lichtheimia ornata]|uniref:GRF-type domain-containing protein n=1 Tax=Lichtheimia ornata TaxID=688661 RepID=A0AAD7XSP4_9FUNG|nr:uncharacterized protein O0I10_012886 [Lichtheimia ornata]KAJ8651548.1 hypothetical protein O0I10_012886 [Lichtheimia ornata]
MTRPSTLATKCLCGYDAVISEVKNSTKNRGRWYWRCSTKTCNFFKWDTSAGRYTHHPGEAYMMAQPHKRSSNPYISKFQSNKTTEQPQHAKTTIEFNLHSYDEISIRINNLSETVLTTISKVATWNEDLGRWMIPATLQGYYKVLRVLPVATPNLNLEVTKVSNALEAALTETCKTHDTLDIQETQMEEWIALAKNRHPAFWRKLKPFQLQAIRTAVRRQGRILLADAPGMGKTMQALGIMAVYKDDRPVLILCQPNEQAKWIHHLTTHLGVNRRDIKPVFEKQKRATKRKRKATSKSTRQRKGQKKINFPTAPEDHDDEDDSDSNDDNDDTSSQPPPLDPIDEEDMKQPLDFYSNHQFYIIPYEHASKLHKTIISRRFTFIVCDDSYYLKDRMLPRVRNLIPALQNTDRLVTIWNDPDTRHPMALFSHFTAIRKDIFSEFQKYGKLYCNAKHQVFGWDYSGISKETEFKYILDNLIWIRRTNDDIAPTERIFP